MALKQRGGRASSLRVYSEASKLDPQMFAREKQHDHFATLCDPLFFADRKFLAADSRSEIRWTIMKAQKRICISRFSYEKAR